MMNSWYLKNKKVCLDQSNKIHDQSHIQITLTNDLERKLKTNILLSLFMNSTFIYVKVITWKHME